MEAIPWWIYLVLLGIIFSAYMTVRTAKKDQEVDQSFIEREGEVYIKRMKKEKEERKRGLEA